MTYGDFAWNDLLGEKRRRTRRDDRPHARFVQGEPVPWMGHREGAWVWHVTREMPKTLNRPYFAFTLSSLRSPRRRGLDDFLKPVLDEIRNDPVSLWATLSEGERVGLRIAETSPGFPPVIDRLVEVPLTAGGRIDPRTLAEAVKAHPRLLGRNPVGVHLTVRGLRRTDAAYGGTIRIVFDGLSTLLGGSLESPADTRICDLRVVRDSRADVAEMRVWEIR